MGLSNIGGNGGDSPSGDSATSKPSFDDKLLSAFSQRYPITSTIGGAIFNGHDQTQPTTQSGIALNTALPEQPNLIGMNAQPKQGGGLSLLKALFG